VDDLFAAIAAHLRRTNRRLGRAPIERVWDDTVRPLALRPCRSCGGTIATDRDIQALGPLLAGQLCPGCYLSEAARASRRSARPGAGKLIAAA
jgi:hypothetical protein